MCVFKREHKRIHSLPRQQVIQQLKQDGGGGGDVDGDRYEHTNAADDGDGVAWPIGTRRLVGRSLC